MSTGIMLKYTDVFSRLMAPIPGAQTRQGGGNRNLTFINATQAANRLDEVLGPAGWYDKYRVFSNGTDTICSLTLVMPDGVEITKEGFGSAAGMDADDDDFKSAESDAFKRAAYKCGVGRYLRGFGLPPWAAHVLDGYQPPAGQSTSGGGGGGGGGGGYAPNYNCPPNGRALFAWMKDRQEEFGVEVLGAVNSHPQIKNIFPQKMTDWDANQVAFGYALMKQIWTQNNKWPVNAGNSPGEVQDSATVRGTVAAGPTEVAPAIDVNALAAIRAEIRKNVTAIIERDSPGVKVTYPVLMMRINALCVPMGFQIGKQFGTEEMAQYTDMNKLVALRNASQVALGGGGVKDEDDIPF